MGVHGAGVHVGADAPYFVEQMVTRQELARVLEQVHRQVKFLLRQGDGLVVQREALAIDVDLKGAQAQHRQAPSAHPPPQTRHPGQQLKPRDALDHVVVCPRLQGLHHGGLVIARSDHQHRHVPAQIAAYPGQQIRTGAVGQRPVDQQEVKVFFFQCVQKGGSGTKTTHRMLHPFQPAADQGELVWVVFRNAYVHK